MTPCQPLTRKAQAPKAKLLVQTNIAAQHTARWWSNASVQFADRGSATGAITCNSPARMNASLTNAPGAGNPSAGLTKPVDGSWCPDVQRGLVKKRRRRRAD